MGEVNHNNNMTELFGKLAYALNMGGSRKDAFGNVAGYVALVAGVVKVVAESGLLPTNIKVYADGFLALSITILGLLTGRTSDLRGAQGSGITESDRM